MFDVARRAAAREVLTALDTIVKSDMTARERIEFYGGEAEEAVEDLVWLAGSGGLVIPADIWNDLMQLDPAFANVYARGKVHANDPVI